MSDVELNPCGFCGSEEVSIGMWDDEPYIYCANCQAESGSYGAVEQAITAWNRVMGKTFASAYYDEWTGKLHLTTNIRAKYGGFREVRFTVAANNLEYAQYILKEMGLDLPLEVAK